MYIYEVFNCLGVELKDRLNKIAADGWRVVSVVEEGQNNYSACRFYKIIAEKEKDN